MATTFLSCFISGLHAPIACSPGKAPGTRTPTREIVTGPAAEVQRPRRTSRPGPAGRAAPPRHRGPLRATRRALAGACLLLLAACSSGAGRWDPVATRAAATQDPPPLTVGPQRASFAADTTTVDDGHADLEVGLAWDPRDLLDSPLNLNVGVGPRTEAYLSTSLWTIADAPGADAHGTADAQFGVRHRFWDDEDGLTFAIQPVIQLPTGDDDEGLGSGEVEAFLGAMVTLPVDDWTWTGFYQLGAIGDDGGGRWDTQHAASLTAGYRVHDGLGLYAEVIAIDTPEQDSDELFVIAGVHHVLDDRWMVDWGIQAGLDDDAAPAQLLLGFTRALGRWR